MESDNLVHWTLLVLVRRRAVLFGNANFSEKHGIKSLRNACLFFVITAPFIRSALYLAAGSYFDMSIFWVVDSLAAGILISIYQNQNNTLPKVKGVLGLLLFVVVLLHGFSRRKDCMEK